MTWFKRAASLASAALAIALLCETAVLSADNNSNGHAAGAADAHAWQQSQAEPVEPDQAGQVPADEAAGDGSENTTPNPETRLITDGQGPDIEVSWDTELKGGDYDSGAINPALSGIGYTDCRVICQLDDRCKAYTHDGQSQICTLKDSVGEKVTLLNARSGIFVDRAEHAATRLVTRAGTAPAFDDTLTWQPGDSAQTYVARTRAAAVPFGWACGEEMAALDALKASLQVDAPSRSGVAGQSLEITWSGNTLAARIPVWIELSTASPVRFSGKGSFALNPGALAPFGIDIAKDETRAFIALSSHSAGTAGSLGVVPLLAGGMQLKSTVVAYLRACQQVVTLSEQAFALDIRPAAPRIVVHDPYALNIYDHQAEIPGLSRKVLYNKDRFLVLDGELGSEILERNGTGLKFSPTRRYLSVRNDNATDVVDLIDGSVVARIGDSQSAEDALTWFHNDSFVAVARAPWGSAWLASTLNVQRPLYIYETSASCCNLDNDGLVDVNLENGLVRILGLNAGMAADLQDFEMSVDYPGTQPIDDNFGTSAMIFLASLGTVSPIPNLTGWNMPQPPAESALVVTDDPAVIAAPPKVAGSSGTELAETRGAISLVKPADYPARRGVDLGQFGFELAPEIPAASSLSPADLQVFSWEEYEEIDKIQSPVRDAVSAALAAKDIQAEWMTLTGDFNADINCDYIRIGDDASPSELPGALTLVQRVERQDGAVWILRSQCRGGGTGGTQNFKSSLMIVDESRQTGRPAREAVVEEHETQASSFERVFHDYDFQTKLIGDRQILFHAPGNGAIGLFDLDTWAFVFKRENLPRGDLLADAHVSADGKFILQVNSDNSFALHRIDGAGLALEGRQVDGETVFWDADFRFDATAEGASFVELRFPGQNGQYTFQQFDSRLRRQALLAAVLKGEVEPSAVTVNVPPRLSGSLSAGNGRITGETTPVSASPLKEIRLYQDGVLTDTFPVTASGSAVGIDAERLPGTRWVSLVAGDQEGLVSLPVGRDLGPDDKLTKTHLLAIGIDSYDDPALPRLRLAGKDAGTSAHGTRRPRRRKHRPASELDAGADRCGCRHDSDPRRGAAHRGGSRARRQRGDLLCRARPAGQGRTLLPRPFHHCGERRRGHRARLERTGGYPFPGQGPRHRAARRLPFRHRRHRLAGQQRRGGVEHPRRHPVRPHGSFRLEGPRAFRRAGKPRAAGFSPACWSKRSARTAA